MKRKSSQIVDFFYLLLFPTSSVANFILIVFNLCLSHWRCVCFFSSFIICKKCKAIILLALVAAVNCAFPNYFEQQRQQQRQRQFYYHQTPEASAQILRNDQEVNPDSFQYAYETSNGIRAQEAGQLRQIGRDAAIVTQGSYSYVSPEGEPVSISYIADENGYQPTGSHIPT